MSFSINRVVLIGRLTRDPELRALPSGTSVCAIRLACNANWRDADGAPRERPNFFDVSVYGPPAETVSRFMHKGSPVAVDGRLEWREWETAEKQKRQAVSIVADTVQFLERTDDGAPAGKGDGDGGDGDAGELVGVGAERDDLIF